MRQSIKRFIIAASIMVGTAMSASAVDPGTIGLLDFDNLPNPGIDKTHNGNPSLAAPIPAGYGGFNWDNFLYERYPNSPGSPSNPDLAVDPSGTASFSSATGATFVFDSVDIFNPSSSPTTVTFYGYTGSQSNPTFHQTVTLAPGATLPTVFEVDGWTHLTKVSVNSQGGATYFDNLAVETPEPSTYAAMLVAGLGIIFFAASRRRGLLGI
jgi:hypothetical protein